MNWLVESQHEYHRLDVLWDCGCEGFVHEHPVGDKNPRHSEPFSQCVPCLANMAEYGAKGASVVRMMREYAEVRL